MIARLLDKGQQVIATGGGAFANADTRAHIRARAISVWLKADVDLLLRRVKRKNDRPLLRVAALAPLLLFAAIACAALPPPKGWPIRTGLGGLIGLIGHGKGAAIGSAVGAGAGTAVQVSTQGQHVKVPAETKLDFTLKEPVVVTMASPISAPAKRG